MLTVDVSPSLPAALAHALPMRSHPRNSPQAAARAVALTLLADGEIGDDELAALSRIDVPGRLDLRPADFMAIVQEVAHELLAASDGPRPGLGNLPRAVLLQMLDEVDDVSLRLTLLNLCVALSLSDQRLAPGEYEVLCTLADHWDLPLPPLHSPGAKVPA